MTNSTAKLGVITNDKFKKDFKPTVTVKLDNQVTTSNDFFVVCWDDRSEQTLLLQNADAITLGQGLQLLTKAFHKAFNELPENDKLDVLEFLKGEVLELDNFGGRS